MFCFRSFVISLSRQWLGNRPFRFAGKAKPSGDILNLIIDAMNTQKEKFQALDSKQAR